MPVGMLAATGLAAAGVGGGLSSGGMLAGILGSSAIGAGGEIAGASLGRPPDIQGTEPWQYALGVLFNLPGFIQGLQASKQARQFAADWRERTDPARYTKAGWLTGEDKIPGRVEVGIVDYMRGAQPYGGVLDEIGAL